MADIDKLRTSAEAARAAADKSAAARDDKDKQRTLAAKACDLEAQLQWAEWVQLQEDAGYTVVGDDFSTAQVAELPEGPTHDVETSG